jgi:hypothetical protein
MTPVAQRGLAAKAKGKRQKANPHGRMAAQGHENAGRGAGSGAGRVPDLPSRLRVPAAVKTIVNDSIVNDSILERRRKLATSRNLRGA